MATATAANVSVTTEILRSDPEIQALLKTRLSAQVEAARAQLAQLEGELTNLENVPEGETPTEAPAPPPRKRGRPKGSKNGVSKGTSRGPGRPSGSSPDHAAAIHAALKGQRGGLSAAEIISQLIKDNKPADVQAYAKTLRTYLVQMSNKGLLSKKGERGSYVYSNVRAVPASK